MKKFLLLFIIQCALTCSAQIDSLSYAAGEITTVGLLAGENKAMHDMPTFREYVRGLRENMLNEQELNSTSYLASYSVGAMRAYFLNNSLAHKADCASGISCLIDGLRQVADRKVTLPQDSIEAWNVVSRYVERNNLDSLSIWPPMDQCGFYRAFGLLRGLQAPTPDEYAAALAWRIGNGDSLVIEQPVVALGMADALKGFLLLADAGSVTAYDLGWIIAKSYMLNPVNRLPYITPADFISGAEGVLGLGKQLLSHDECEAIIKRHHDSQWSDFDIDGVEVEEVEDIEDPYISERRYDVDWNVEVYPLADYRDAPASVKSCFGKAIGELPESSSDYGGALMAVTDIDYVAEVMNLSDMQLPEGYAWFSGMDLSAYTQDKMAYRFGIVKTDGRFESKIREVTMGQLSRDTPYYQAQFRFDGVKADEWASFTRSNIGRFVVMKVNGVFVMAPKVNSEITGGACAITLLDRALMEYFISN